MKKYIHKINQYLLENHPTIWNTRIVWMTLISLFIHLAFFVLGYFALTNPERLHSYGAKDIFFENGTVFFSIILSILLFVIWLVYLFKNNSFKNFYPTSQKKLFLQFLSYLVILFLGSTFYISYAMGVKSYITNKYPDDVVAKEIETTNNAAVFFSHKIGEYEINERRFPFPFNETYWETELKIKRYQPYVSWLNREYQLHAIKTKKLKDGDEYIDSVHDGYVYYTRKDSSRIFYYKDTIVDLTRYKDGILLKKKIDTIVTKIKKGVNKKEFVDKYSYNDRYNKDDLAVPSYYNYSTIFYSPEKKYSYNSAKYRYSYSGTENLYNKEKTARNKKVYNLLKRNDANEIKKLLQNLLDVADVYKVTHNLSVDEWFKMVYHPEKFEIKSLIRTAPYVPGSYTKSVSEETAIETFTRTHLTNYFIKSDALIRVFDNLNDIKNSNSFLDSLHFFMWLSFILAMLIFIFRISGIRNLIFSVVTGGLLMLLIALIALVFNYMGVIGGYKTGEFFVMYLSIIIINLLLFSTLFYAKKLKKIVMSIFVNISLSVFIVNLFLIISVISLHQRQSCIDRYDSDDPCIGLIEYIGVENMSILLFVSGIVFVYFYASIMKKWKGSPEG